MDRILMIRYFLGCGSVNKLQHDTTQHVTRNTWKENLRSEPVIIR